MEDCTECDGTGWFCPRLPQDTFKCAVCGGSGKVPSGYMALLEERSQLRTRAEKAENSRDALLVWRQRLIDVWQSAPQAMTVEEMAKYIYSITDILAVHPETFSGED